MSRDERLSVSSGDDDATGFAGLGRRGAERPGDRSAERRRRTTAARRDDGDTLRWRWLAYLAVGAAAFAIAGMWTAGALLEHANSGPAEVWVLAALDATLTDLAISVRLSAMLAAGVAALAGGWVALSVALRTRGGR